MPANRISAADGSSRNVMGSSNATVSAGPMPGSTPTAVPIVTPINAHIRFAGVSAPAKPSRRSPSWSTSEPPGTGGQGEPDQPVEDQEDGGGQRPPVRHHPPSPRGAEQQRRRDEQRRRRHHVAEQGQQDREQDQRDDESQHPQPGPRLPRRPGNRL